jgi:hypothetical protein
LLPLLVALKLHLPRPKFRLDIWLLFNVGFPVLMVGTPLMNIALMLLGGTLVFVATSLLVWQLYQMRADAQLTVSRQGEAGAGRKFYLMGLVYFLLGITLGTGMWMGFAQALNIHNILEVHIHANNWGLMSLVFAGLLVDLFPRLSNRQLAWPRSVTPIFWLMSFGALGLVLGPWFNSLFFTIPGLIMHLTATIWLLLNVIVALGRDRRAWTPGLTHMVAAYFWILAPILIAPLIILQVPGIPGAGIERNAPQALVYGWVLQFGLPLIPYFLHTVLYPKKKGAVLGGNRWSLGLMNLGGLSLWISIFAQEQANLFHAGAYVLWSGALLVVLWQSWTILRGSLDRFEEIPNAFQV